jgi:hypothetical protein
MIAPGAQVNQPAAKTSRCPKAPREPKVPNCCAHTSSSSPALCHSVESGSPQPAAADSKKMLIRGQKILAESQFCRAFESASGRLEKHAKKPIYSIAC